MKNIKLENVYINIGKNGHFYLSGEQEKNGEFSYGYFNSSLIFDANYEAGYEGEMIMPTSDLCKFREFNKTEKGFSVSLAVESKSVSVEEKVETFAGLDLVRQCTSVTNEGTETITLTRVAPARILGIGKGGSEYFEKNRFKFHYCLNRWQGEGQWQEKTAKDIGIYPASLHTWEECAFRLQSIGSWCTKQYYPLLIIEDTENNECWFFECDGYNWFIEVNAYEGYTCPFLCVTLGGLDETIGFDYKLTPGETYTTDKVVYGLVKGNFNDAVNELIKYKRLTNLAKFGIEPTFNDFMNCNWAMPTYERLVPLIDTASKIGIKRFCIDAGWGEKGEWAPYDNIFGEFGFKGIIDYIKSKGMLPGVWFEFERVTTDFAKKHPDWILKRHGKTIAEHSPKLDLSNEEARKFLIDRIAFVYDCGVRFIKNDHNNDEKIGIDRDGKSFAEGMRLLSTAVTDFIKEVRERFPDLIIESCASGGARENNGFLRYFDLQSVSDQEDYRLNPSIVVGQSACILPEKMGIWAYPYPLLYKHLSDFKISEEELASFKDGRETVYNMVCGMAGYMYLSGRIELADEFNLNLIKESINVYNGFKDTIKDRFPVYFGKMKNMDDDTFFAYGLENGKDMLLYVWANSEKKFSLDLGKFNVKKIEKLYPSVSNVKYSLRGGKLDCSFKDNYSACVFTVTL